MGGGNGQKSAAKRDRNNAKKMKESKQKNHAESKAKMEADKTGIKCKICMTTFLITANVRVTRVFIFLLECSHFYLRFIYYLFNLCLLI